MRWFTIMVASTSPHTCIMCVKRKARLVLLCRSTSQTNGATASDCPNETHVRQMVRPSIVDSRRRPSPRMHSLFVRWFGRPVGLTPTSTHRFLACIQRQAQLALLHRSASQTNGLTASDCPNETRVHHILFQHQWLSTRSSYQETGLFFESSLAPQKFNFWSVFVPLLASQNSILDNSME